MPGGIIDLQFTGASNIYLTGNPQITYFKNVYKKYSNFSMEYIELPFKTISDLQSNTETKNTCKIERHADLVKDIYLLYDLPAIYNYFELPVEDLDDDIFDELGIDTQLFSDMTKMYIPFKWVDSIGNILINETSLNLNGQSINKLRGEYMEVKSRMTLNESKKKVYDKMVNGYNQSSNYQHITNMDASGNFSYPGISSKRLYVPLDFWFCKNSAFALPLIALQYTLCDVDIQFSRYNYLFKIGNPLISPMELKANNNLSEDNQKIYNFIDAYIKIMNNNFNLNIFSFDNIIKIFIITDWTPNYMLLANYIFLDNDERKFFAQTSHEYLIQQTHYHLHDGLKRGLNKFKININHPVTEFIWYLKKELDTLDNNWFNFTTLKNNILIDEMDKYRNLITNITEDNHNLFNSNYLQNLNKLDSSLNIVLRDRFRNLFGEEIFTTNRTLVDKTKWDNYSIMKTFKLLFNGNDRFSMRDNKFFEYLQIYKYHSGNTMKGLYNYNFSLDPENIKQPSGAVNMSRINKQEIEMEIYNTGNPDQYYNKFDLHLYSVNYNVFRIIGGIGQITFSN